MTIKLTPKMCGIFPHEDGRVKIKNLGNKDIFVGEPPVEKKQLTMRDVRTMKIAAGWIVDDGHLDDYSIRASKVRELCEIIERMQAALRQYEKEYWGEDAAGLYGFTIDNTVAREALLPEE